ncbi:hypothetical protein FEM03_22235 [Phragmitibacter flavus]|uniref:Uncharacterized protein n=1 Tax=Phragmitibacter flavus TaxID=2576071 RepID=A0A5R8K889_9BACT|nr:hypothetical protein [Phragmitibacter flavus]TLD68526.1 hypothetical protein FEM03_22235 [Phragmitibacter flavus]
MAVAADATTLDTDYGLAAADLVALQKETDDYAALVVAPSVAIAQRKAQTQTLPPLFRQANLTLAGMDRLIKRFRLVAGGPELIAAYQAARIIRDAGHGPGVPPVPTA